VKGQRHNGSRIDDRHRTHILDTPPETGNEGAQDREGELDTANALRDVGYAPDAVTRTLADLKAMRPLIAIDDFGTGYSSLSYLKRFAVDILKIDQSFVRDLTTDPDAVAIDEAIVALARTLRLAVVAEGVETREQVAALLELGCDEGQGYFFSRPVPPDALAHWLATWRS